MPDDVGLGLRAGADLTGAALVTAALMLAVYTVVEPAAELGWTSPHAVLGAAAVALLLAGFVVRQATAGAAAHAAAGAPLADDGRGERRCSCSRSPACSGCSSSARSTCSGCSGTTRSRSASPSCPATLTIGLLSLRYAHRLALRFGAQRTSWSPASPLVALALALFTRAPVGGSYLADVLPVMLLLGAGVGGSFPALMTLAMTDVPRDDAGLASGLINTTAQVGGALGLAVLATVAAARTDGLTAAGSGPLDALTGGYHLALWIAAGLVLAALAVTASALGRQPVLETGQDPRHPAGDSPLGPPAGSPAEVMLDA